MFRLLLFHHDANLARPCGGTLRQPITGSQTPWTDGMSWTGEVCSAPDTTSWKGVTCVGSRVASVNLYNTGASGSIDGFGQLTALSELWLGKNRFSGVPLGVSDISPMLAELLLG